MVDKNHTYTLVDDDTSLNLLSKRSNNVLNADLLMKWCNENALKLFTIEECIQHCFETYNKYTEIVPNLLIKTSTTKMPSGFPGLSRCFYKNDVRSMTSTGIPIKLVGLRVIHGS
jgi:hypothetical protein